MLKQLPGNTSTARRLLHLACAGASAVAFHSAGASDYPPPPGPYQSGPTWEYHTPAAAASEPTMPPDVDSTTAGSRPLPLPARRSEPRPGAYDAANLFGTAPAGEPSAGLPATAPLAQDAGAPVPERTDGPPADSGAGHLDRSAPGHPGGPQYPPAYRGGPAYPGQMPYVPYAGRLPHPAFVPPDPPLEDLPAGPDAKETAGSRFRSAPRDPETATRGTAESDLPSALSDTAESGAAGAAIFRPADRPAGR